MQKNTTGTNNTAVGHSALSVITTSRDNTTIGYAALATGIGSNNTAIGSGALYGLEGNFNVAIGYNAGRLISSGSSLTTSLTSIFIGSEVKASGIAISNETVIGYQAIGGGSNSVTLGNSSITKLRC